MSQITRCPACATQFKVVADQLRISEGWVRCGQCKEVFDAAAHLVAAPPPPMLPDVSLTDTRPPPVVVVRQPEERGAWGVFDPPAPNKPAGRVPSPPVQAPVPSQAAPGPASPAVTGTGRMAGDVFEIPEPAVPAFLSAARAPSAAPGADELSLEPLQTFGWRAPPIQPMAPPRSAPITPPVAPAPPPAVAFVPPRPREESRVVPGLAASLLADLAPVASPVRPVGSDPAAQGMVVPAGYELPVADFPDVLPDVDRDGYEDEGPDTEIMSLPGEDDAYPPLDLPNPAARHEVAQPDDGYDDDDDHDDGIPLFGPAAVAPVPAVQPVVPAMVRDIEPQPEPEPVQRHRAPVPPPPPPAASPARKVVEPAEPLPDVDFELVPDPVFPASAPAFSRPDAAAVGGRAQPAAAAEDDNEEDLPAGRSDVEEVSFVRAARRKAFWRRPLVRTFLVLALVLLFGVLALQVAVQERSRIAAMDARTRPWLQQLCTHLGCTVAPRRQIADLVIDSSSFAKARGDGYLLSLTVKSRADMPLEMPAVELTLTDAQDQPVLRRVLLPADLAAPAELAARGEWSTTLSVAVTSGASRVSGYRVMTFYP